MQDLAQGLVRTRRGRMYARLFLLMLALPVVVIGLFALLGVD